MNARLSFVVAACACCGRALTEDTATALPGGYYCVGRCAMQRVLDVLCKPPVAESDRRLCQDAITFTRAVNRARGA